MSYAYRYLKSNRPLRICPECRGNLGQVGGITIELSNGAGHNWETSSRLDHKGYLEDPNGEVEMGLHSCTRCGHCDEMLINMKGVHEMEVGSEN